jgi:hypothetical protein
VECSGGVGGGLDIGKEAWVDGGGGVDGGDLDRNVWVVREGSGGLEELCHVIWPRKGNRDGSGPTIGEANTQTNNKI